MRGLFLFAVMAGIALAGCSHAPSPQKDEGVAVTTTRAERRSFKTVSELSGALVASRSVTVGANASGRLSDVPVRVGDHVEAGQVLGTIDSASYAAALAQARGARSAAAAAVGQAQAALGQAQARERLAESNAHRYASLYSSGDISRQQYEQTQADWQTARAAVDQARAAVDTASGSVAQSAGAVAVAAVPLRDTVIRAPFSGVVTQKFADDGAVVTAGSPLVAMEDDRALEAELAIPEGLVDSVTPGTPVRVHVDALDADTTGRVRALLPSEAAQLHTGTVRISLVPRAGLLRGMFVRVRVASRPRESLAVPWRAIVTRAGQTGVFAVKDRRAVFVPVETGGTSNGWIAVSGLADGTAVAVTGLEELNDGTAVALR